MTLVIDCGLPREYVCKMAADIALALRAHSEVFRNVRLNLFYWKSEDEMENRVIPISFLQMSQCFEDYAGQVKEKSLDALSGRLKFYHARSKLILVLAGKNAFIDDREVLKQNMYPFLGKKSLFLFQEDTQLKWRRGEELPVLNADFLCCRKGGESM